MSAAYDAVVIGAGPAGLAAATRLAEENARVLLLDEQPAPGGQIYRGIEHVTTANPALLPMLGAEYAHGAALAERFRASAAEYRPQSTVWNVTPEREIWFSREGRSDRVQAGVVIAAPGAMERPVPVPGWTLPGVMGAGGVQILLKSAALRADEPLVIAGAGPLFWLLAQQCIAAGANIAAVLDTNSGANQLAAARHLWGALRGEGRSYITKGLTLMAAVQRSRVPIHRAVTDIRITGTDHVTGIEFRAGGRALRVPARLVALHEGVIPAQQMTRGIGCAHVWDSGQFSFRPAVDRWGNSSIPNVLVAGDGAGIGGARAAEHSGRIAAFEALRLLGRISAETRDALAIRDLRARAGHLAARAFLDRLYAPPDWVLHPADDVMVCRCEEITAGAIRDVVKQGCLGPNQAKSFLRAGMGPCQGRMCGPVVSALIAQTRGCGMEEVGYYRIRPPLKPITLGELAALEPAE